MMWFLHAGVKRTVRLLALVVHAISIASITGYVTHKSSLYTWGADLGMGFPTAVCFIMLSVGVFLVARED
jgi:hypothetical protein